MGLRVPGCMNVEDRHVSKALWRLQPIELPVQRLVARNELGELPCRLVERKTGLQDQVESNEMRAYGLSRPPFRLSRMLNRVGIDGKSMYFPVP